MVSLKAFCVQQLLRIIAILASIGELKGFHLALAIGFSLKIVFKNYAGVLKHLFSPVR